MWALFEIGLVLSRLLLPHRVEAGGDEEGADQATS